jgi:hypothetical protein
MTTSYVRPTCSFPEADRSVAESRQLQFEVIKLDYERTLGFLDGVSRTRTTMRSAAITAYLAFLSLAVQQDSLALAVAASAVALVFGFHDMYHGWLYRAALRRANQLERLFQHRLRALERPYDSYPLDRLQTEIERYAFGSLGQLPRFRARLLKETLSASAVLAYAVSALAAGAVACLLA